MAGCLWIWMGLTLLFNFRIPFNYINWLLWVLNNFEFYHGQNKDHRDHPWQRNVWINPHWTEIYTNFFDKHETYSLPYKGTRINRMYVSVSMCSSLQIEWFNLLTSNFHSQSHNQSEKLFTLFNNNLNIVSIHSGHSIGHGAQKHNLIAMQMIKELNNRF